MFNDAVSAFFIAMHSLLILYSMVLFGNRRVYTVGALDLTQNQLYRCKNALPMNHTVRKVLADFAVCLTDDAIAKLHVT